MKRKIIVISAALLIVAADTVLGWCWSSFLSRQKCLDALLESVPPAERELPPRVDAVFVKSKLVEKYDGGAEAILYHCRNLDGVGENELRLHKTTWKWLIPLYFNRAERRAVFVHLMDFGEGRGLAYGARRYFSKEIGELTEDEAVKLILISRTPGLYADADNAELDRAAADYLKEIEYQAGER
ncbi:MAG: transglycosylase domain-containing protein [Acidobacteria bacterium]|nr:transglycosylase domain-containing protein [Acidobacteriota bacterium]